MKPQFEFPGAMPGHWTELNSEVKGLVEEYGGRKREDTAYGQYSDFAIANAVFMASRNDLSLIHYQTAAKERIRWLSVKLAAATIAMDAAQALLDEYGGNVPDWLQGTADALVAAMEAAR